MRGRIPKQVPTSSSPWCVGWLGVWATVGLWIGGGSSVRGQAAPPPLLPAAVPVASAEPVLPPVVEWTPGTDAIVRSLLLQLLPREYENTKQWGKTRQRWDGLRISFDDGHLETRRRWKEVNHGTWTRYKATLVEPERYLRLRTSNLRQSQRQSVQFDLVVDLKLALTGRVSEWRQGVQLYSFSADADAVITLTATCETGLAFDTSKFPPDVKLAPRVNQAQVDLREFELHRISDADGPVVRKLGDGLKKVLQDELEDRRAKLVEKMNRALDKQSGKLTLSIHDLTVGGFVKGTGK